MTGKLPFVVLVAVACVVSSPVEAACPLPAIHIHKGIGTLIVTCAGRVRLRTPVTFGGTPKGHKRRSGDQRTPEGAYFVCSRHRSKRFYKFIGISYPGLRDAKAGLRSRAISRRQYRAMVAAARSKRRCPPWTTRLGGAIGIHGVTPKLDFAARIWNKLSRLGGLFRKLGFTSGCIATNNRMIDRIWKLARIGTPVYIHPVKRR